MGCRWKNREDRIAEQFYMHNFGVTSMGGSQKRCCAHISKLFGRAALHRAGMLLMNQFTDVVDTDVKMTKTAAAESSFAGCNSCCIVLVNYCQHILQSAKTFRSSSKARKLILFLGNPGIFGTRNKFCLSSRSSSCVLK